MRRGGGGGGGGGGEGEKGKMAGGGSLNKPHINGSAVLELYNMIGTSVTPRHSSIFTVQRLYVNRRISERFSVDFQAEQHNRFQIDWQGHRSLQLFQMPACDVVIVSNVPPAFLL